MYSVVIYILINVTENEDKSPIDDDSLPLV